MAISTTIDAIQPDIYVGTSPSSLTKQTDVYCNTVNQKIAPQMSQATLVHYYGRISTSGNSFSSVSSLSLVGKYVEIKLSGTRIFFGIIASQGDSIQGTYEPTLGSSVPGGNNNYTAFSLDFLLDRAYLNQSMVNTYGNVKRLFVFNGESGTIEKNRTATKTGDYHKFDFSATALAWTGLDIVEYALSAFGSQTGVTWSLSGQHSYLEHITPPSLDPNGKTIRDILNEIINPAFGFSWIAEYLTGTTAQISVFSTTDTAITYDSETIIPVSTDTGHLGDNFAEGRIVANAKVQEVEQSAYSTIRVYSEPVRVMCSLKCGTDTGGMAKNWTTAQETAYKAANDQERQDEKYEKVYSAFKLSENWDKTDFLLNGAIPAVNESDLSVTFSAGNPWTPMQPFDRTLPKLVDSTDPKSDYRKPVFFVMDDSLLYHISDKITHDGQECAAIGLAVNDDWPGMTAKTPWRHILAKEESGISSSKSAMYDYNDCLLTVSFYSDAVLAYAVTGATTAIAKTKEIYIPGYHYWVALAGTKIDPSITESGLTEFRDDRDELAKMGAIAKAWYGRVRNTVSYNVTQMQVYNYLGYVVTNIYTGGSFTPGGTIINSIDYDFLSQSIAVSTDFLDLDLSKMSRQAVNLSQRVTSSRISRMEEKIKGISVRDGGGGGGDSYNGPWKCVAEDDYIKFKDSRYSEHAEVAGHYDYVGNSVCTYTQSETFSVSSFANGTYYFYFQYDYENYRKSIEYTTDITDLTGYDQSLFFKQMLSVCTIENGLLSNIMQITRGDIMCYFCTNIDNQ